MSEINVTPFVDVMLVLLIVFMVTAPLLTVGIPVDLPKVKASALTDQKDPIEITVNIEGEVYIGCLLYTSPSPRDKRQSRMPSSA